MRPIIAKLARPRAARIVERSRLLMRLDNAGGKTVWISAPAGSGKTTLVANWLDSRKQAGLWYQADAGDRDIASFFSYLAQAVQRAAPNYRTPLPLLTSEYSQSLPIFSNRYFEEVFRRLAAPAKPPVPRRSFIIVIDNYQDVPLDSAFHEVVKTALEHAPEGISFVIISRIDPPPMFARLQANGSVAVLGREEIWFTFEESQSLARLREKNRISAPALKALHEKTQGWAAGLVLLLERMTQAGEYSGLEDVPREHLFDYFSAELFDRADAETRSFLLTSAFLPRMSNAAASELTGFDLDQADRILGRLSRTNFFIQRHVTPEIVYQYHPLFREFLLKRANASYPPEETVRIRKKAALLLFQRGRTEDAATLLIEVADWQGLTGLVLDSAKALLNAGRTLTLETWINSIPAEKIEQNGWLLYWKAMCRLSTRPTEARAMLESAYSLFVGAGDSAGAFLSWAGVVDTFMYECLDFHLLDGWIEEFVNLRRRFGNFPSLEVEERATSAIFAALMFRQPHHPDLPYWTERVQFILQSTPDLSHRMFIGNNLILYLIWAGRINEAGALVSMLSPVIKPAQGMPLPKLMCYRGMSVYYCYVSQAENGMRAVEQGLQLAEETGIHLIDVSFFGVAIYHAAHCGDLSVAQAYLDKMTAVINQGGCYTRIYHSCQSSLIALLRGDLTTAVALAEHGIRLAKKAGVPLLINVQLINLGIILMEARLHDRLPPLLAEIRMMAAQTKSVHLEAWCSFIEAMLALRGGDEALLNERLRKAIDVCRRTGLKLMTHLPNSLALMCMKALELDIETDFVKELIRLNKLIPDRAGAVSPSWPYPLKIKAFGRFELLRDDRPMTFEGKVQQKPLAMLKALIALGGHDVEYTVLTDALWPDAEGDLARRSFDTTLHRLRKLLTDDRIIQLQEGKVSLDNRYCWVDALAFEEALGIPSTQSRDDGREQAAHKPEILRSVEKALRLYRGHFLPGAEGESWAISARERLRSKYTAAVIRLGGHFLDTGHYEKSAELFLRGLEIDDLSEGFYQNLMLSYLKLGRKAEAATTYSRCRSILAAKLGLEPSERTKEIYRAVKG